MLLVVHACFNTGKFKYAQSCTGFELKEIVIKTLIHQGRSIGTGEKL